MKNREVAEILYTIAEFLEMNDIPFKPRAYQRAAQEIEGLSEDIEDIAKQGRLDDIPGVGKSIAEKIQEYLDTGHVQYLEELKKQVPVDVHALSSIEGIGPKTIKLLYKKLKITTLKELVAAAKAGKIRKIKHLGAKTEQNILDNAPLAGEKRFLLGQLLPEAEQLKALLKKQKEITAVELAGSLRRKKETIGDIDILVVSTHPAKTMQQFTTLPIIGKVLAKGTTRSAVRLKSGVHVDLRIVEPKSWGSALLYFTGSKIHNIELRKICMSKGYKLNEYGLFRKNRQIAGKTEEEVYKKMGMQYIPPEMRENTGEIACAQKKKIPVLVEQNDIKGDLQMHTTASDGVNSIQEMAQAAQNLGYQYIAITDHTGDLAIANGLNAKQLLKHAEAIRKVSKKLDIDVLAGAEVNIRKDGSLDISNTILKQLDVVLIAIHSSFKQDKKTMTKRLLKAMDSGVAHIFAHPTARLIEKRKGIVFDYEKIFEKAKEQNIALEINAQPNRLDLRDIDVKAAVEHKVLLSLGTDAHATDQLKYISLAVATARRGWATKNDIINTYTKTKLKKFLER